METIHENLREFVDELRQEWRIMWRLRVDDKVRAEGISDKTYERLFVDRGTILIATRNYNPPNFNEILGRHLSPDETERLNPNPVRGGVRKFIREYITTQNKAGTRRREVSTELENMKRRQQLKKGGRGWLHFSMNTFSKL